MAKRRPISGSGQNPFLVNKLTITDARHLLRLEGGELSWTQVGVQAVMILLVAGMTARAILVGGATAWHLALPMVGEYLALLVTIPLMALFWHHSELRSGAWKSLTSLIVFAGVAAVVLWVRAKGSEASWQDQTATDATRLWQWIVDAQMHWPIVVAAAGMALAMPGRVRNLFVHGPPFVSVNLGCAMRVLLLFVALMLLPFVLENALRMVWILWTILVLADVLALWMHWDIQRRLKKLELGEGTAKSP